VLATHGGVRPPERLRNQRHLSAQEREEVTCGIAAGASARAIAASIGRSPSTVSREIARNGGRTEYRAAAADVSAWERARRPKMSRLASNAELLRLVREKLELDWSPEQIAHWLK
jgi:IS30 family transposase